MRILIGNDGPHAFFYVRVGWAKAFHACGHDVAIWHINEKPVHDIFDEFNPDIFIFQSYNLNPSIIRAIEERPHLRCFMKAGEWGPYSDNIPPFYEVLKANQQEMDNVLQLREKTGQPEFLEIYYHPDWVEKTHENWIRNGIPVHSLLLGADIFDYTNGQELPEFKTDICFVGGYWPYKSHVFDHYMLPLCGDPKLKIKIFGSNPWPVHQYCGFIQTEQTRHALASATICPNLHERHSQDFGYDINERTFKLLSNRCFVISDHVEGLKKLFNNDEIVMANNSAEFIELVNHYIQYPSERQPYIERGYKEVMTKHTYFHRCARMFELLNMPEQAQHCMNRYKEITGIEI